MSGRRIVTLPTGMRGDEALQFATEARLRQAQLLEVRSDLSPEALEVEELALLLDLLVSQRGRPLPARWLGAAKWVDAPLGSRKAAHLTSYHSPCPLTPDEALTAWRGHPIGNGLIKHVEPLADPRHLESLLKTQARLQAHFGADRVCVLAVGAWALPSRCILAKGNALDYLAASPHWSAAPGQRLLDDAVREQSAAPGRGRLGLLGCSIASSRLPELHPQPFDRIEVPKETPLETLLESLAPHYRGLAIGHPFQQRIAQLVGSSLPGVDTLVRRQHRWEGFSTGLEMGLGEQVRRQGALWEGG